MSRAGPDPVLGKESCGTEKKVPALNLEAMRSCQVPSRSGMREKSSRPHSGPGKG